MNGPGRTASYEARIRFSYDDEALARAVHEAVEPDNRPLPEGLSVRGWVEGKHVIFEVSCSKSLGSFWATIDDLLACVQTAEKALRAVGKPEEP